jgi:hypothetical protein
VPVSDVFATCCICNHIQDIEQRVKSSISGKCSEMSELTVVLQAVKGLDVDVTDIVTQLSTIRLETQEMVGFIKEQKNRERRHGELRNKGTEDTGGGKEGLEVRNELRSERRTNDGAAHAQPLCNGARVSGLSASLILLDCCERYMCRPEFINNLFGIVKNEMLPECNTLLTSADVLRVGREAAKGCGGDQVQGPPATTVGWNAKDPAKNPTVLEGDVDKVPPTKQKNCMYSLSNLVICHGDDAMALSFGLEYVCGTDTEASNCARRWCMSVDLLRTKNVPFFCPLLVFIYFYYACSIFLIKFVSGML